MRLRRRPAIGEQQNVLIDEELRKCVAFLCADVVNEETGLTERKPAATTFFIRVPISGAEDFAVYAVTARHVLDMSRPHGPLYIRLNTASGFEDISVSQDSWVTNPTTDVAVARVSLSPEQYDFDTLSVTMLVTDSFAQEQKISEGDEVFFVGLFQEYWGAERAQPIARFGNISLGLRGKLPLKLNPHDDSVLLDAYLVEARSWGGHSGSPAFVYFTPTRELMRGRILQTGPGAKVLGLVHGHYQIERNVKFLGDILGSGKVPVNAGIAAVIPSQKIIDTLMREELVEERERLRQEQTRRQPTPTPDSDLSEESYQRSDFMRDLKKVAKKQDRPSRPDQEKR